MRSPSIRPSVPPDTSGPYLSVIIPAYNEERRIGKTLSSLDQYLRWQPYMSEVLVVDDGSRDRTCDVVTEASTKAKVPVRLIKSERNRGKGHAVRSGMLRADGDILAFYDADGSAPPEELPKFLQAISDGADVAVGSRMLDPADVERSMGRKLVSRTFNFFVRSVLGLDVADTQCGIKAFQRQAAHRIFRHQTIDGFAFDCEILVIAQRQEWTRVEIPVRWTDAPGSKVNVATHSLSMLYELARIQRSTQDVRRELGASWRPRTLQAFQILVRDVRDTIRPPKI
jgi:glycosyltransferase involved in cell wall biosynthesis